MKILVNITKDMLMNLAKESLPMEIDTDDFDVNVFVPLFLNHTYDEEIIVEFEKSDES